ncbi:hypothetical protein P154DRAFT_561952 [Amniculicola lignicola CBS 123094]|uniref:Uncharacterized protein n=1 Tax=Amniculicola lignicola CBS 123094 TaxID=1392246 RepID=A0A6A5WL93_9PLEO|nr:hypothetical protein P154DRAFT_561952 [Amniculicola lignicola CBS 123094]
MTSQDCATVVDLVASLRCRDQAISKYPLTSLTEYNSLPSCAQSVVSYNVLSQPYCIAAAVPGPGISASQAYAPCVCSSLFGIMTSAIRQGLETQCSSIVPRSLGYAIAQTWCIEAAGGFFEAHTGGVNIPLTATETTGPGITTSNRWDWTTRIPTEVSTVTVSQTSTPSATYRYPPPNNNPRISNSTRPIGIGIIVGSAIAGAIGLFLLCLGLYIWIWGDTKKVTKSAEKGKQKVRDDGVGAGAGEGVMMSGGAGGEVDKVEEKKAGDVIEFYQPRREVIPK